MLEYYNLILGATISITKVALVLREKQGIEDNYYLLRPINLLDGTQVKSRKLFWQANAEAELIWGTDYIIGSHQAAVSLAKGIYHPNLIETADREIISDTIRHGAL